MWVGGTRGCTTPTRLGMTKGHLMCVCVHVCEKTEQEEGVFEIAKCDWSVPC